MIEEFRDIPNYEGIYQVSDMGRVKSLDRMITESNGKKRLLNGRVLKPFFSTTGYFNVGLRKDNKLKTIRVHQLVAMSFLGHTRCGHKLVVDHINNDKLDNRLINLQIITARENTSKDKKRGTSKYLGVNWDKVNNKWLSTIHINGKNKYLGRYTDELEAAKAYQDALKAL